MGGGEPERFVEPAGVGTGGIGGELHHAAPLVARPGHRRLDQLAPDAGPALRGRHPHPLELRSRPATVGQAGQHRDLHAGHQLAVELPDEQEVVRIGVDPGEGHLVGAEAGHLAADPELVVAQQGDDGGQIAGDRRPERRRRRHAPSRISRWRCDGR